MRRKLFETSGSDGQGKPLPKEMRKHRTTQPKGTPPFPCYGKKAMQWGRTTRRRLYGKEAA